MIASFNLHFQNSNFYLLLENGDKKERKDSEKFKDDTESRKKPKPPKKKHL